MARRFKVTIPVWLYRANAPGPATGPGTKVELVLALLLLLLSGASFILGMPQFGMFGITVGASGLLRFADKWYPVQEYLSVAGSACILYGYPNFPDNYLFATAVMVVLVAAVTRRVVKRLRKDVHEAKV